MCNGKKKCTKTSYVLFISILLIFSGNLAAGTPFACWTLDELGGEYACNSAENGKSGLLTGGILFQDGSVAGKFGKALYFNGLSNSYIEVGTSASLSLVTDFSVSVWVRTQAQRVMAIVNQRSNNWNGAYLLMMNANGTVRFGIYGNSLMQYDFSTTQVINDGAWHHIIVERQQQNGYIFIDGILAASATGPIRDLSASVGVNIGGDTYDNNYFFYGTLDDIRIYNYALNLSEVETIRDPNTDQLAPGPVSFEVLPFASSKTTAAMRACSASDISGVEYYFKCTAGGGHDSGWQDSPYYEDIGLNPATQYQYAVKARDKSPLKNESALSVSETVTTESYERVGHWKFDELSGYDANDSSRCNHDALLSGGLSFNSNSVSGKSGRALAFDGINDSVACGTGPSLSGKTDFTVSAWIKTSSTVGQVIIAQRSNGWNGIYWLMMNANGTLNFTLYGNSAFQFNFSSAGSINDNLWHHVCASRTGTEGLIYIDGAIAASACGAIRDLDPSIGVVIGADTFENSYYFNGAIDDVRIYNYSLSSDLVRQLYLQTDVNTAPVPDKADFAVKPHLISANTIAMEAAEVLHAADVEYYFDCISGNGHDSGWQTSPYYEDTQLNTSGVYSYSVKARSCNGIETGPSPASSEELGTAVLKACWRLDDPSGNKALDCTGNGNTGTLNGGLLFENNSVQGKLCKGLDLDGVNDYISAGTHASLAGPVDLSVCAWVKTLAQKDMAIINQRSNNWDGAYLLMINANGTVRFGLYGDGQLQYDFSTTQMVPDGLWHHIVAVRNQQNGYIYIDGALAASSTGTVRNLSGSVGVNIGADTFDNNYFIDGAIDDVRIYEGALSTDEIQGIYNYSAGPRTTFEYHGIRPTDPNGRKGLLNPERGFRLEMVGGELQPGAQYYPGGQVICLPVAVQQQLTGTESNDDLWVKCFDYYKDQGLTLALMYVYLTDYWNSEIPQSKLDALQTTFDHFRNNGYKAIPLFLYERVSYDPWGGPTVGTILSHLDQLEPVIKQNADVIAYMRAGFVGAYGEWHHSYQRLERDHDGLAQIMNKLLHVVPENRMICIRVPQYKRWILRQTYPYQYELLGCFDAHSRSAKARIGHADDGFMASDAGIMSDGYTWPEPPFYSATGNPEFDMMTGESPYVAVDGEMFIQNAGGVISGYDAAKRLRLHHYTSLSFFHGNNEMELYGDPNPPKYNINTWQETNISKTQLITDKMPISDGYFEDGSGNPVDRTQFEYVRDHFGYRFELQRAIFPEKLVQGQEFTIDVELINRGFAAALNERPVYIVMIDQAGQVLEYKTCADPRQWQPFKPGDLEYSPLVHSVSTCIKLPENIPCGTFKVGLWMPDACTSLHFDPRYSIRVANRDVEWWSGPGNNYGVDVLGQIQVFRKPELHWEMDEGTGATVIDSSGNDNVGTVYNAARVAGIAGGAIEFNGAGQYIDIGSADIPAPWTVSLWVKRQLSPNTLSTLLNSNNSSLRLEQFNNSKKVGFTKPGIGDYAFNYEAPVGQWTHLVFVGTQTGTSLWVNGSFIETISASIPCPMSTVSVSWPGGELYGAIDDLQIYSEALDQAQIDYLYAQMPPNQAINPDPSASATGVSIRADLSWTPGLRAASHKIYFGTDPSPDETEYVACQTGTSYDPGILAPNTTYYWRIDEVSDNGKTTGTVWSFTTAAPVTIFSDGFEYNFNLWTDGGTTDWTRVTTQKKSGTYSATCGATKNDLISDNLNTAGFYSMTITCYYMDDDIDDDDDAYLQLYDGANYDNKFELGNTSPEDTWHSCQFTIYNSGEDAQYFRSNFRLKFEGTSLDSGENLWIDDVSVVVQF